MSKAPAEWAALGFVGQSKGSLPFSLARNSVISVTGSIFIISLSLADPFGMSTRGTRSGVVSRRGFVSSAFSPLSRHMFICRFVLIQGGVLEEYGTCGVLQIAVVRIYDQRRWR